MIQQSHYWAYDMRKIIQKDTSTPMFTAALFAVASTWKLPNWWVEKMWYMCTMDYHSATKRKETGLLVVIWMDLESVIQSEVRRERQISHINVYWWNQEKWYRWACMQGRNRDAGQEDRHVNQVGEGEGEMNWECSIDMYTLVCVRLIASGKRLSSSGSSAQCSVMT